MSIHSLSLNHRVLLAAPLAATALLTACSSGGSSSGGDAAGGSAAQAPAAGASVTVKTHSGALGTYLTDGAGRALYLWKADSTNMSACAGQCATYWPPLAVTANGSAKVAGQAAQAKVATITRSDGIKQVTYNGHPLYYFVQDAASGTTKGQGDDEFGAKWWVVTPAGAADTKASTTSDGDSGGGGGNGGY
jgi:predicted lipoprotein with Yx(FWY)xxD motif